MKEPIISIKTNDLWSVNITPLVTVITTYTIEGVVVGGLPICKTKCQFFQELEALS
jgi:hypothetical protein